MNHEPNSSAHPEDFRHPLAENGEFEEFASHPHDAFFKRVFSDVGTARAFFMEHLPTGVTASVNWESLKLEPGSFVKQELKQSHSDLLFSALMDEDVGYVYFLFEHQTSVDGSMPLRLLGYMSEIWLRFRNSSPTAELPIVIPYVLHQGPEKWNVSTQFADQVRVPSNRRDDLIPFVPQFTHALLDLTQIDPLVEEHHDILRLALGLMQQARQRQDLLRFFEWLNETFPDLTSQLFRTFLLYALHVEASLDVEALLKQNFLNIHHKTITMTAAAKLEARGEARGESRGKVIGETTGILKGKIRMLEQFLGREAVPQLTLDSLELPELESVFSRLQADYDNRFKTKP